METVASENRVTDAPDLLWVVINPNPNARLHAYVRFNPDIKTLCGKKAGTWYGDRAPQMCDICWAQAQERRP